MKLLIQLIGVCALLMVGTAYAAPVDCPAASEGFERFVRLDTSPNAKCLDWGGKDSTGEVNPPDPGHGYKFIEKDETSGGAGSGFLKITNLGGTSGTFSISALLYQVYQKVVIAFKFGNGQDEVDWAQFELTGGQTSGTWAFLCATTDCKVNGLSHAEIWAKGESKVPAPGVLALLGLGLLGMGAVRRRRA